MNAQTRATADLMVLMTATLSGIAIVILVDVSGSMAERDFDWHGQPVSRFEAVQTRGWNQYKVRAM